MGVMGSGVAAQVKRRFPDAYAQYTEYCVEHRHNRIAMLGQVQFCPVKRFPDGTPQVYVANLFAQYNYGRKNALYTDYEALKQCLTTLADFASENNYTIAIPYRIGCDRGGGDWNGHVYPMIQTALANCEVLICHLPQNE